MLAFFLSVLESDEDRQRFVRIYEQYHAKMEQIAISILEEQHDAEDAVQNAFCQIIRHFEKTYMISYEELFFWITTIVKNEAIMIRRKRHRIVPLEDWENIEINSSEISQYTEIVELFNQLPETYRAVMEMKFLIGYTDKEISSHLGISTTAVSTRVNRGRTLLKKLIEKEGLHI